MSPRRGIVFLLLVAAPFLRGAASASASDSGTCWGRIVDDRDRGIAAASVELGTTAGVRTFSALSEASGLFSFAGLTPGVYHLKVEAQGYKPASVLNLWIEPRGHARVTIRMEPVSAAGESRALERREAAFPTARTVISREQIERLPTAHSVWSLVENQDFSATTNRIDVGGFWSTIPALFSARGACSWTQNVYLLNGFDVSDPVWTGTPLLIPDVFALRFSSLGNAAHPAEAVHPGAAFDLIPAEGTAGFHGRVSGFYLDKRLSSTNLTPALAAEGITETNRLNRLSDFNLQLSGPLGHPRWRFFSSWTSQSASRDMAQFDPEDESRLASGLIHITRDGDAGRLRLLWTGQAVSQPTSGAGRGVALEATSEKNDIHNVLQVILESTPRSRSSYRLGLSLARSDQKKRYPFAGRPDPYRVEIFEDLSRTAAPWDSTDGRTKIAAAFDGRTLVLSPRTLSHELRYGIQLRFADGASNLRMKDGFFLRFADGVPSEVVTGPASTSPRESSAEFSAYVEETLIAPGGLSLSLGGHVLGTYGRNPSADIRWLHVSPRVSVSLPFSRRRTSDLRISAARYYHTLPLNYLSWGNPEAPGFLAYAWEDRNGDGRYSPEERGSLLRKEGPRYGAIDSGIRRPFTDEFLIALVFDFGRGWLFSAAGYLRESRDLVETANVGVPFSAYTPVLIEDFGDDRIPGTHDDLDFTVYSQKPDTLGLDAYFLGNPGRDRRSSTSKGFDVVVVKRPTSRSLFFLALTATEAYQKTSPGNTEWENDDGVVGALDDNPNAAINARGRPRFDRAYTGRLGCSLALPLGFSAGAVIKYYDGQPFARYIKVLGFPQGAFLIQAHPRGVARYEFNLTVDLRLEKRLRFGHLGTLRVSADVFNAFNQHLATEENPWTGPEFPLRFATEIESPRVARLGLTFAF
jgi:hypothetical protein